MSRPRVSPIEWQSIADDFKAISRGFSVVKANYVQKSRKALNGGLHPDPFGRERQATNFSSRTAAVVGEDDAERWIDIELLGELEPRKRIDRAAEKAGALLKSDFIEHDLHRELLEGWRYTNATCMWWCLLFETAFTKEHLTLCTDRQIWDTSKGTLLTCERSIEAIRARKCIPIIGAFIPDLWMTELPDASCGELPDAADACAILAGILAADAAKQAAGSNPIADAEYLLRRMQGDFARGTVAFPCTGPESWLNRFLTETGWDFHRANHAVQLLIGHGAIREDATVFGPATFKTLYLLDFDALCAVKDKGRELAQPDGDSIPIRIKQVGLQYQDAFADLKNGGTPEPTDRECYDRAKQRANEEGDTNFRDFDTWARYVRDYRKETGTQKNKPRKGRTGRNVVSLEQL